MSYIAKLFRLILLFWLGCTAVMIMTMFGAYLAMSH